MWDTKEEEENLVKGESGGENGIDVEESECKEGTSKKLALRETSLSRN